MSMGIPNNKKELLQKETADKEMAKTMAEFFGKKNIDSIDFYSNNIYIKAIVVPFDDNIAQYNIKEKIFDWYDNNKIIKAYKKAVINRGNIYKIYNNTLALKIQKVLYFNNINTKFAHLVDDQLRFYDLSPVIIEYDKNGNIYSLLIVDYRVNVAFNQFQDEQAPVRIVADIGIYSTKPAQRIRNYIGNYEFQNALIYTSKKSNIETSNPRVESNALSDSNNKNIKNRLIIL